MMGSNDPLLRNGRLRLCEADRNQTNQRVFRSRAGAIGTSIATRLAAGSAMVGVTTSWAQSSKAFMPADLIMAANPARPMARRTKRLRFCASWLIGWDKPD